MASLGNTCSKNRKLIPCNGTSKRELVGCTGGDECKVAEWRSTAASEDCEAATTTASSRAGTVSGDSFSDSRSGVRRKHIGGGAEDDDGAPPEKDSCDPSGS
ncbi:hypothetical protein PIB30_055454 [Stylosanthes scabra]|uniref:Uncharacterized protein n=1 Tax=Stylosanthes scabra TaxID=79078 RepID=A0ABU6XJC7_9FABA|nr:hypothetical protein [Stylosanthes scabra]